jgi:cell division protein FtsW
MFFVFVANVCSESFKNKSEYKIRMIVMFVITMLYISILWQQPSYSMSIIILLSCLVVVFISGIPILYFALSLIFVASIVIAGIYAEPYRAQRILALLSPGEHASGSSYQWLKAREAIYSGGGFGVGLGNSTYKKNILPEPHNDFIMAIVIEEVGVFFASAFAILMFYFMIRMLNIARKALQTDMFAGLLGTAMVVSIMIGIIINLGFVIGVLPVTGIPFPLLSYGGSFMIYTMICVGVIFRINYEQKSK